MSLSVVSVAVYFSWVLVDGLDSPTPTVEVVFGHSVVSSRTISTECDDETRRAIDSLLRSKSVC